MNKATEARYSEDLKKISNDFEAHTRAELVLAVAPNSGIYTSASLLLGAFFSLIALTIYIGAPIEFYDDFAFVAIILSFLIGYTVVAFLPPLQRLLTSKKEQAYYTELQAQAFFTKQQIYNTKEHTGLLVMLSLTEKRAELVVDTGVTKALTAEQIATFKADLQAIWSSGEDLMTALAKAVAKHHQDFATALPRQEDDIDELGSGIMLKKMPRFLHGGFGMRRFTVKQ
jgi:putative membrane protein